MGPGSDDEFGFELRTCRWLERTWPPGEDDAGGVIVARQLGTRRRRWDVVVLEASVEALRQRARFGPTHLDGDLLHVVRHAPAEWTYYRTALPEPDYPWRYVREAVHEAADRGILETRRSGNRIEIRRRHRYPDWVDRLITIENKPDLGASAARRLTDQLEFDVAAAIADEVWLATRRTGRTIEPALREDIPGEVGILAVDPAALEGEVTWFARQLAVDEVGTRILERPDGSEHDESAARIAPLDPGEKRDIRLEIAERAYERGWRSFVESFRSDCRHFRLVEDGQLLPHCDAHGRAQTAAECAGSCRAFEPEPPGWRTHGWPLGGGPGAACRRLLETRRRRRRPGL